jgi:hypothetical protein
MFYWWFFYWRFFAILVFSQLRKFLSFSIRYYIVASEKGESGPWMKSERCKKYEGEKRGVGDREKKKDQKTDAESIFVKPD